MANVKFNKSLAKKVMNPSAVGGGPGGTTLGYTDLVNIQLGDIRRGFISCASRGFDRHALEGVEAALNVLHTMTMPYHYKDYLTAYKKAMGTLKLMDSRDKGTRKEYFDLLMAWWGAQLHQLKRMGLLMERSGIIDFD